MKELEDLAEKVKNQLSLAYDAKSIKYIEEFIERQRHNFDSEQVKGLVNSIGSFIGQCIIKNYGGQWQIDDDTKAVCVALDEKNKIFPFAKTAKQFENGIEDSVYSFYVIIPTVFKLPPPTTFEDSSNVASAIPVTASKKWWKFW
jgi:hypothetical protein